ncbi:MAG: alginate export family protein [Gammaproteobacteria bacterium]|nr:alginate export family protein [Gammaproteobacteria bacterium]MDH3448587.1 alginate export family protein [Gammaproteobacteria bacterium]
MQKPLTILLVVIVLCPFMGVAADAGPLDYGFQLNLERSTLAGLSLGAEPDLDQRIETDLELELTLEYPLTENLYLFFTGVLFDNSATIESIGSEAKLAGLERKAIGVGYFFGEQISSELILGRMEFVSSSDWWPWWNEELDAIRIESTYGDFEAMLALAEEQARDSSGADFIDPEFDGVQRLMLSLGWEFAPDHRLVVYYLDQSDGSRSFDVGDFEQADRIDEEDSNLRWSGISYLGGFEVKTAGEFEIELHGARVSGDETVYEFDDPSADTARVSGRRQNSVSGSAQGFRFGWTPAQFDEWTLVLGSARGSGDIDPDDGRERSFRQTGLQGDTESYGELYQPELSNLVVDLLGVEWAVSGGVALALLRYDYRQRAPAIEMRDVSIELDLSGTDRDLGSEIDLVITVTARDGLELRLTAAEFDPGRAYGAYAGEGSSFFHFELAYEF